MLHIQRSCHSLTLTRILPSLTLAWLAHFVGLNQSLRNSAELKYDILGLVSPSKVRVHRRRLDRQSPAPSQDYSADHQERNIDLNGDTFEDEP